MAPAPSIQDVIQLVEADATGADPLSRLRAAAAMARGLDDVGDATLGYFVEQARRSGHSWSEIGDALGVTKQAAQQRQSLRSTLAPSSIGVDCLTPRARKVIAESEVIARSWGTTFVGTEHLLLALFVEPRGIAARILDRAGLEEARISDAVQRRSARGTGPSVGALGFTVRLEAACDRANAVARELGHPYVGTEHLLIGLLEGEGVAAEVLREAGLQRDQARALLSEELAREGAV